MNKIVESTASSLFEDIKQGNPIHEELISNDDYQFIQEDLNHRHFNKIEVVRHYALDESRRVVIYKIELFRLDEENNIVFARADNVLVHLSNAKPHNWKMTKVTCTKGNETNENRSSVLSRTLLPFVHIIIC